MTSGYLLWVGNSVIQYQAAYNDADSENNHEYHRNPAFNSVSLILLFYFFRVWIQKRVHGLTSFLVLRISQGLLPVKIYPA